MGNRAKVILVCVIGVIVVVYLQFFSLMRIDTVAALNDLIDGKWNGVTLRLAAFAIIYFVALVGLVAVFTGVIEDD